MRPTQSGTAEPTQWRDTQARHVPGWIDGPNKKSVTEKRGLLGKVGEGHDQRGGVMQRQVKMWLEHGPAPGNSI